MKSKALLALTLSLLLLCSFAFAQDTQISDDIYSFQMLINGQLYALPLSYHDFTALGWVYDGDDSQLLDAGYYTAGEVFELDGLQCYAQLINFDINAQPLSQCYVAGIDFDSYQLADAPDAVVVLPAGLTVNKAVQEDAQTAYGTPTDVYEGSLYTKLTYRYESYREVELEFSAENAKLNSVSVRNLSKPEDFVDSDISGDVPSIVSAYTAPESVSDRFDSYTFSYGGTVYQLPAPVSVFVSDGWRLIAEDSEAIVAGRDSGWVTLMKDNQKLRTLARNYSQQATAIENCFVTSVKSGDDCKVELITPKGITVGMSEADLKAAVEGENVETEEGSSYSCYIVIPGESKLDSYEVYVRDGAVYKIEVSYAPKYSDYAEGK
ncbi:MAG: hypothetical protein PHI98_14445 [Eubacteriales bacterium]|nr:hypothetical protein [Eubacteriales bacterium]